MLEKIKKFWDNPYFSATLTILFFIALSALIFVVFWNAKLFENNLTNMLFLTITYIAIICLFIFIVHKSLKLIFLKSKLDEKEFSKIWKKRFNLANKAKKEKYGSKNYKELWSKIENLTKKLDESSITFKDELLFFTFSIYFGLLEGLPFWAIKQSTKNIWQSLKKIFKPYKIGFKWYKTKNGYYIINSFIYKKTRKTY